MESQLKQAASSLLKFAKVQEEKKNKGQLFEEKSFVYMVVGLTKIPDQNRNKPYRIDIPFPIYDKEDIDLCLFVKDAKPIKDKLDKFPVRCVKKVLSLQKLRTDFKDYEAKRRLLSTYDMFMTEKSILPMLPKVIGSKFFKKKKQPLPIQMSSLDLGKPIQRALNSTYLYLPAGSSTTVRVGTVSMSPQQLAENVTKAIEGVSERLPRKFKSIKSLHLKTSTSVALPFFNKYPDAAEDDDAENVVVKEVEVKKVEKKKKIEKKEKSKVVRKKNSPTKRKASDETKEKKVTKKMKVDETKKKDEKPEFIPSKKCTGRKPGYVFLKGRKGLGWYIDTYKPPSKTTKKRRRKKRR